MTDHVPTPRAPLAVETDLTVRVDGARAEVRSTGDRLFVEFASLFDAVRALRRLPPGRFEEAVTALAEAGLTVEVRSRGRTVAAAGADAPAGPVSRALGTAPVQIRLAGVFAAVGQELSAAVGAVGRAYRSVRPG